MSLKVIKAAELENVLKINGRGYFDEDGILFINWTNCSVEFSFTGKMLVANFVADFGIEIDGIPFDDKAPRRKNWPYFAVIIDGADSFAKDFTINTEEGVQKVLLWESDVEETHTFKIIKLSENYKTYGGVAAFEMDGTISAVETTSKKRIEFIGDSITCGFGNGTLEPNGFFHSTDENGYLAHGAIAARELGFEASIVSVSGICSTFIDGVPNEYAMDEIYKYNDRPNQDRQLKRKYDIRNKFGEIEWCRRETPLAKDYYYKPWDFKKNHNDIVVLNLGTNDCIAVTLSENYDAALKRFYEGYRAFVEQIRELNGKDTYIICALGSMDYYLFADIEKIVAQYKVDTGDNNISCFRYNRISPWDGYGTGLHPSLTTHEKMAHEIVAEIKRLNLA